MPELPERLEQYFDRLWPINRSIAGPGIRASLEILDELMPMERIRVATGEPVLDWTAPREWEAREAYIVGPDGRRHADLAAHNLHLVAHSIPFRGRLSLAELRGRIHTLPEQPDAIPYVTSLYTEDWGFCMTEREAAALPDGEYEVVIDTELRDGHVEIGEAILEGESQEEVLFSSYACHPSLANNELSGPLAIAFLYDRLSREPQRRLTYRFAITAETIGTLCYLRERGRQLVDHLVAGYVVTCVADPGPFTYKLSRRENTLGDRAAQVVLRDHGPHTVIRFDPGNGSDERQYCSPGYDLPMGSVMRTMYSCYPEYHTSLDNKNFISFDALAESVDVYARIVAALEANETWWSTAQLGEPQLGRRGLYRGLSTKGELDVKPLMWLLNFADGKHDLLAIAERSGQRIDTLISTAQTVAETGLIVPAAGDGNDHSPTSS